MGSVNTYIYIYHICMLLLVLSYNIGPFIYVFTYVCIYVYVYVYKSWVMSWIYMSLLRIIHFFRGCNSLLCGYIGLFCGYIGLFCRCEVSLADI